MQYQIPKGLFDILPYGFEKDWQQTLLWQTVEKVLIQIARDYGFQEVRTPMFEKTEVFVRGIGTETDIVSKEMYTFMDKGDRSMTLRPEGTASVIRTFVENNFASLGSTHKLYYIGPMFRYERMQAGRYRQFHQFGVELIGDISYENDVEVIDLQNELYNRLQLKNITLNINSVGDSESRTIFKEKLMAYLKPHLMDLSQDSQERFHKNPLRILDSKDEKDQIILKSAPSILECLSPAADHHFKKVCHLLSHLKIPYKINDRLVRGLDYYTNTVFEFVSTDLGAQNAIGGGGRYDSLVSSFGGNDLPGVGFATGLERVIQTMLAQKISFANFNFPFVYFAALNDSVKDFVFEIATELRHQMIPVEMDIKTTKIQKALQKADKLEAKYCAIIGEDEWNKKVIQLKNLSTREQMTIPFDSFISEVKKLWQNYQGK
jgi:histidyl-tRNA synthetase